MMDRGDKTRVSVCNNTGVVSIYNPSKNLYMSPMADGPVQFDVAADGSDMSLRMETNHGREFSVVEIPYAMKLMMQELQAANISVRVITEDNMSHMKSLTGSERNVKLLTRREDTTLVKLVERAKHMKWKAGEQRRAEPMFARDESVETVGRDESLEPWSESIPTEPQSADRSLSINESPKAETPSLMDRMRDSISSVLGSPAETPEVEGESAGAEGEAPMSPGETPESESPTAITGGAASARFSPGETVVYHRSAEMGLAPEHPWTVRSNHNEYISIETQGIGEDNIRVAAPSELSRPGPVYRGNPYT
jgi:hypothetical protein